MGRGREEKEKKERKQNKTGKSRSGGADDQGINISNGILN